MIVPTPNTRDSTIASELYNLMLLIDFSILALEKIVKEYYYKLLFFIAILEKRRVKMFDQELFEIEKSTIKGQA